MLQRPSYQGTKQWRLVYKKLGDSKLALDFRERVRNLIVKYYIVESKIRDYFPPIILYSFHYSKIKFISSHRRENSLYAIIIKQQNPYIGA